MHIIMDCNTLREALLTLRKITDTSRVLLDASTVKTTVSGTNKEIGVTITVVAEVKTEGTVLLPLKMLMDILGHLSVETLTLRVQGERCFIHTAFNHGSLPIHDHELYTRAIRADRPDLYPVFSLGADTFRSCVEDVSFCAAKESDGHVYLTSILVKPLQEEEIEIAATNFLRLAHRILTLKHSLPDQLLLPSSSVLAYVTALKTQHTPITCFVAETGNVIVLSNGIVDLSMRTMIGIYPSFKSIYPLRYSVEATVQTDVFLNAVELCRLYNPDNVIVEIRQNEVSVYPDAIDTGEWQTRLQAETKGDQCKLMLHARYVSEIIQHAHTEAFTISCDPSGPRRAIVLSPGDGRVRYTVLPLVK